MQPIFYSRSLYLNSQSKKIKIKIMSIKLFTIMLAFLMIKTNDIYATDFSEKELIVEMKINPENLKDSKCNIIKFKLLPTLTKSEVDEWLTKGKNHNNVASFNLLKGNQNDGWEFEIIFKNGLDYATGKELFSSTLFIDFFILNGEKMETYIFVPKLSYK